MSIKRMHYLFKQKLNKIDSNQNINFRVPEIDVFLREAELMFIRQRILKNTHRAVGSMDFTNELSDDLISVIKTTTITEIVNNGITLPEDYLYYGVLSAKATKGNSTTILKGLFTPVVEELNSYNASSFEWGELNLKMRNNRIEFIVTNDFVISEVYLTYVKKPKIIHNAEDYSGTVTVSGTTIFEYYDTYQRIPKGLSVSIANIILEHTYQIKGYKDLAGMILFGYQDSELPYHTLDQIVDIAVLKALQSITNNMEFQNNTTNQPKG